MSARKRIAASRGARRGRGERVRLRDGTALGAIAIALCAAAVARSEPQAGDLPVHAVAAAEVTLDPGASRQKSDGVATVSTTPALRWLPSRGRQCIRRGRYRGYCEGPRRAPEPHGAPAELAKRLGLGEVKSVSRLLLDPPPPDWALAAGTPALPTPAPALLWPVADGKLWRGYGRVRRPKARAHRHRGIDVGAPEGTPIRAAQSGLVVYANNEVHGFGNLLVTVHPDASVALYAHCQAVYVFPGQHVERGQHVADVGHTGIARGSHLHFEYRVRGYPRDPLPHFDPATVPAR